MVKIFGCSDDLVEIENSNYKEDEIDCFEKNVIITFKDETKIKIGYCKNDMAIWWIKVLNKGNANQNLIICNDENADIYSDIFEIDSEIVSHRIVKERGLNE